MSKKPIKKLTAKHGQNLPGIPKGYKVKLKGLYSIDISNHYTKEKEAKPSRLPELTDEILGHLSFICEVYTFLLSQKDKVTKIKDADLEMRGIARYLEQGGIRQITLSGKNKPKTIKDPVLVNHVVNVLISALSNKSGIEPDQITSGNKNSYLALVVQMYSPNFLSLQKAGVSNKYLTKLLQTIPGHEAVSERGFNATLRNHLVKE